MQPTEYPRQQREDETGVSGKGRERNSLSLVHMSTLQLGKHPLLNVCRVNMGEHTASLLSRKAPLGGSRARCSRRKYNFVHQTKGNRTNRPV